MPGKRAGLELESSSGDQPQNENPTRVESVRGALHGAQVTKSHWTGGEAVAKGTHSQGQVGWGLPPEDPDSSPKSLVNQRRLFQDQWTGYLEHPSQNARQHRKDTPPGCSHPKRTGGTYVREAYTERHSTSNWPARHHECHGQEDREGLRTAVGDGTGHGGLMGTTLWGTSSQDVLGHGTAEHGLWRR